MQPGVVPHPTKREARSPLPDGTRDRVPREPSLNHVIGLLWRRKALILSTILLTMLATVLVVFQLAPLYTAETQVLIAPRVARVVDIEDVLEALRPDRATIQSEVEVLGSRWLAEKVVDELGLVQNPEFNRHQRPPPPSFGNPLRWFASLNSTFDGDLPDPATPEEAERRSRDDTVTALLAALTVKVVKITRVVSVAATSADPNLSATLANTVAEIYLREQRQAKAVANRQATAWLNERVAQLRDQVEQSNRAVEDFRLQRGLTQTSNTMLVEQQISGVNTQLIAAKARTAEANARLTQAHTLMRTEEGIYAALEVLDSTLIQNLRMQEVRLAGEAARMATEYGRLHPKMINVNEELSDIRAKIAVEVERIVQGLENDLEVAQTRERTLEESLEDLKGAAARLTQSQAQLRVLEHEAAANQSLFDVFLARLKETGQQEDLHRADARIISRATLPERPSWPNRKAGVAIGLVVAILLALLLVFVVEQVLERGFQTTEQIEDVLGVGLLATVPMLHGGETQLVGNELDSPTSTFAESFRMLHTGLLLADIEDDPSVSILITSSVAEEGKTFIALALARLLASTGRKILLVDADLRHGEVGKRLKLSGKAGLADLLTGRVTSVEEATQRDERSGLDVLTVGGRAAHLPTDILRSHTLAQLIARLKPAYEMIIVDSPPALLVADARTLSRVMDKTAFVVRWSETSRKVAAAGLKTLVESGAQVSGVVLSMVEAQKSPPYFPYYGSGTYGLSKKYRSYYAHRLAAVFRNGPTAVRMVPILIGATSVVAGVGIFWQALPVAVANLVEIDGDPALELIRGEQTVGVPTLHRLVRSRRCAGRWRDASRIWTDIGLGHLMLAGLGDVERHHDNLALAENALTTGLALAPMNPHGWMRLVHVRTIRGQPASDISQPLQLALHTGPHEDRHDAMLLLTLEAGLRAWSDLSHGERRLIADKARKAWRRDARAAAAAAARAGKTARLARLLGFMT